MKSPKDETFSEKEAQARFEVALKGAMATSHKPLKEKPREKRAAKKATRESKKS